MSLMNEVLKLNNIKLQLNNLNIQFDTFLLQLQSGLTLNIGMQIEEIALKILNLGLEMLNIEMQSNNIPFFNSTQQIKNIGDMIQNIALQMFNMNSMKMPNFNIGMPLPNIILNNNVSKNIPRMNIIFKTTKNGTTTTFCLKHGTTVKEMIEKYCKEKGISLNDERFAFIYQAQKINKDDLTPIESFFEINPSTVIVNDTYDLIGG